MARLIWDFGDPSYETSIANPVSIATGPSASTQSTMDELRGRVDRLSLICCAMWSVIQAQTNVSDDDLIRLMTDLDLADGQHDGRVSVEQVGKCSACQRPVSSRHVKCIYCGQPRRAANPFDAVL
jgi:hypothetical protein